MVQRSKWRFKLIEQSSKASVPKSTRLSVAASRDFAGDARAETLSINFKKSAGSSVRPTSRNLLSPVSRSFELPFTPPPGLDSISGLVGHWKADAGVTTDGGTVTQWDDQGPYSQNPFISGTITGKLEVDAGPPISIDVDRAFMSASAIDLQNADPDGFTVVMIMSTDNVSNDHEIFGWGYPIGPSDLQLNSRSGRWQMSYANASFTPITASEDTSWECIIGTWETVAGDVTVYYSGLSGSPNTGTTTITQVEPVEIFDETFFAGAFRAKCGEIAIYNKELTQEEINTANAWAVYKYGVVLRDQE